MTEESGWLIESGGECIGIVGGEIAWVPYTYENALRFARMNDAENMLHFLSRNTITHLPSDVFVSEHGWYSDPILE